MCTNRREESADHIIARVRRLSAAPRHISSCRCGSSAPTPGEDVLGVSSVPAQIWPGAAGAHEVLGLLQEAQVHHRRRREAARADRHGHANRSLRRKRKFASSTCRTRRAQRAPSRLAGCTAYLSEGRSKSALVPQRRPHAQRVQGDPRALLPRRACTRDRSATRTCRQWAANAHLRQQPDGCQTFVSPQTQLLPRNAGCSSNRCEGWLPFLKHPMDTMQLASALQSRHLYRSLPF
jgi:hypothetical protein